MPWFPSRWPPTHPDRIQLYSLATPNGQKIGIALEELELGYDAHLIDIGNDDQFDDDYLKLSPNGKIPTLSDPNGPDGEQVVLMETGAILLYLADKTGRLLPAATQARQQVIQWLFFQVAHVGPMFGQFGHFLKFFQFQFLTGRVKAVEHVDPRGGRNIGDRIRLAADELVLLKPLVEYLQEAP